MKVIHIYGHGGPEVLRYEDAEHPVPGPGEVLIRVAAAGINPADREQRFSAQPNPDAVYYYTRVDGAGVYRVTSSSCASSITDGAAKPTCGWRSSSSIRCP